MFLSDISCEPKSRDFVVHVVSTHLAQIILDPKSPGVHLLDRVKSVEGLGVQKLRIARLAGSVRQIRIEIQIHVESGWATRKVIQGE